MAGMGIADYFAKGADWFAQVRKKRRVRFERATRARPDMGQEQGLSDWFKITDGVLLLVGGSLRVVAFMGFGIGVLLVLFWIGVLLAAFGFFSK